MSFPEELVEKLKEVGLQGALAVEERDPQLHAVSYLLRRKPHATPLVVANALVSYQLSMKGEEYWWAFAKAIAGGQSLKEFLREYNRRLLPAKLQRLEKSRNVWEKVSPATPYEELYLSLYAIFGPQKTVSFAVKMLGYAKRALGRQEPFPFSIPLPYDSRMERLSKALGVRKEEWQELAERVGIPPLHLDSLLWNAMAFEGRSPLEEVLRKWVR